MPVLWGVELGLVTLMGRAASGGVFSSVYELSTMFGSLSADGRGCVPVLLAVWPKASSTGAFKQLGATGS